MAVASLALVSLGSLHGPTLLFASWTVLSVRTEYSEGTGLRGVASGVRAVCDRERPSPRMTVKMLVKVGVGEKKPFSITICGKAFAGFGAPAMTPR